MAEVHKTRAKHALAVGKLALAAGGGRYTIACDYMSANDLRTHMAVNLDVDEARRAMMFLAGMPELNPAGGGAIETAAKIVESKGHMSLAINMRAEAAANLAAIKALADAIEPFAKCADEIDDEDAEEWAKFRLVVKEYRAAREALRMVRVASV